MKNCFKCGLLKELKEFYKHPQMPDGHVNKCKECNKKDVRENRSNKIDYYREYDRERGCRQDKEYLKKYRSKYPKKYNAHKLIQKAIKSGKLFSEKCQDCGDDKLTHAHHDDYSKPLNIRWLCPACHKKWHDINGEGING
jgi:hypothetical protein